MLNLFLNKWKDDYKADKEDVVVSFIDEETGEYSEMLLLEQDLHSIAGRHVLNATFRRRCIKDGITPVKILAVEAFA